MSGTHLTPQEISRIRALRYEDGLTMEEVARITGRSHMTVRRHAPGRPGKVPVAPLREAFLASPFTAADVARELGWFLSGNRVDTSRVKRTLGIYPDINSHGVVSHRQYADAELVQRIAEAINISPWSVLPDDDEQQAA